MDKLDKWTTFIISLMVLYTGWLLIKANGNSYAEQYNKPVQQSQKLIVNPELDKKIELARNLLTQDSLEKSEALINTLIGEYPYEGKLYMLKGDILMRRQQPIAAMYEYKEAVGINPDFIDKKAKLFQGKKIKVTIEEAMAAIESGLEQDPKNIGLREDRKTVYYMQRKLAGSCG